MPSVSLLYTIVRHPGVLPRLSPMIPTSNPTIFSFVEQSTLPNGVTSRPAMWSATTRAMALPGPTRPYVRPLWETHSPIAYTLASSVVTHSSVTAMPPRGPTSRPQSFASWSRGRIPVEKMTMSISSSVPSSNSNFCTPRSSPTTRFVTLKKWQRMPRPSTCCCSIFPAVALSSRFMRLPERWMTWHSSPMLIMAWAASSPSSPPPSTTALLHFSAYADICCRSSILRYTKQPGR
mmetsp:Transcript_46738/g.76661  ORF Transcript_46738/g.76661 Transcript_46738/m.76661 type:complete len:235 (+) Transcript_46738:1206-1910(+)